MRRSQKHDEPKANKTVEDSFSAPTTRKIVYIDQFTYPQYLGGAQISMWNLLKQFKKLGYDVSVYGIDAIDQTIDGIKINKLEDIDYTLVKEHPEFVFTQLNIANEVIEKASTHRIKSVLFVRSFVEHICERAFKRFKGQCIHRGITTDQLLTCPRDCNNNTYVKNKETFKKATYIVANSVYMQKVIRKFFNRNSILQYPSIEKKKVNLNDNTHKYITCIAAQKGEEIIEKIISAYPNEKFYIVDKNYDYYKNLFPDIEGTKEIKNIDDIIKRTKLLLACPQSFLEAFGRTPIEFGQYGVPTIASNQGGLPESVGDGGILIDDYRNYREWVNAIDKVLDDETLYDKLSNNAILHAKQFENYNTLPEYFELKKKTTIQQSIIEKRNSKKIYFVTENCKFYSGGRYFNYEIIKALVELGYQLTVFTNEIPSFKKDFRLYLNDRVVITRDIRNAIETMERYPRPDLVIGSPVWGNINAIKYAEKYNVPVLAQVLDPLNLLIKNHPESQEYEIKYFQPMIKYLEKKFVDIFVMTEVCKKWTKKWLGKNNISIIAPVVNSRVLDVIPNTKKKNWICYVSRLVERKNFIDTLKAFSKTPKKWELHIITSFIDEDIMIHFKKYKIEDRIVLHENIDDYQKFEIMKQCKIMINSSLFEGYGMWVIEGLACGMKVVCYEQDNFYEIAEGNMKNMYMAKFRDFDDFQAKLFKAINALANYEPKFSRDYNFDKLLNEIKNIIDKKLL